MSNVAPIVSLNSGSGSLDPTFGNGGKVTVDFNGSSATALQVDGKLVVVGSAGSSIVVARYNMDGNPDTSFGTNGKVTSSFGGSSAGASSAALEPDGKIVVSGHSDGQSFLVRYNTDGSLDTTFGINGQVMTDFGGKVAIDADGKIVLTGSVTVNNPEPDTFIVTARYNLNGSLDTTFGAAGKAPVDFDYVSQAKSIAVQSDGKIVVGALAMSHGQISYFGVARYNADGSLDSTFGTGGMATTDFSGTAAFLTCLALQPDGKILVGGNVGDSITIALYNPDGSLDTTFGNNGIVNNNFFGNYEGAWSLAIQPDGKILVGASGEINSNTHLVAVRYNADGSLDTTFGNNGKLTADNAVGSTHSVILRPDGKFVLTESTSNSFILAQHDASILNYSEGQGARAIDGKITLTDPDSTTLASATIRITGNYRSAEDLLAIDPANLRGGVIFTWDSTTGALILTGLASKTDYDYMLEHVTYSNSSHTPNTNPRTVSWTVNDGSADCVAQDSTITVQDLPNQVIMGDSGNNTLNGTGASYTMIGLPGDDTYFVDDLGDVVVENTNEGNDTVLSSISYTLPANVEKLILTGTAAIAGTGNELNNMIFGNSADNVLKGCGGNDTIYGGAGNDTIYGGIGNDRLEGDLGNDTLYGVDGDDILFGRSGSDYLEGGLGDDKLDGGDGDDTLVDTSGNNYLEGGAGNDTLTAGAGNDKLCGCEGDDRLVGGGGDDQVYGGVGNDTLIGQGGNDTLYGSDGVDKLYAGDGNDTLHCGVGNDLAEGGAGSDILHGNLGDDTLNGSVGNDTYMFARGDGKDTIKDYDPTSGNVDTLAFGSGISRDQVWFSRVGNDLQVSVIGTEDKATISNWYSGAAYQVEQFKTSDGQTLLNSQVDSLVSAMAAFAPPAAGQTSLSDDYKKALQPVIAANWR